MPVLRETSFQSFPSQLLPPPLFRLPKNRETSRPREVNQFRVKAPIRRKKTEGGGTVPRAGRMQVRRKSGCLKEKPERRVSALMHDPTRAATGRRDASAREGETREELGMKHGSASAVCSFRATELCNLFANPGYCGTAGLSLRRRFDDAAGGRCSTELCQVVLGAGPGSLGMRCRRETCVCKSNANQRTLIRPIDDRDIR